MVRRGEMWWVDGSGMKRRPMLVLTRDTAIPHLNKYFCIPATTRARGLPSEVALDEEDGMPTECVLAFDNATVVSKHGFVERICRLGPERMAEACRALAITTGCSTSVR